MKTRIYQMTGNLKPFAAALAALLALTAGAHATDYYWDTTTEEDWSNGNNWSTNTNGDGGTGTAPSSIADFAFFNGSNHYGNTTVRLNGNFSIGGLTFNNTNAGGTTIRADSGTTRTLTLGKAPGSAITSVAGNNTINVAAGAGPVTIGTAAKPVNIVLNGSTGVATQQYWTNYSSNPVNIVGNIVNANNHTTSPNSWDGFFVRQGAFVVDLNGTTGSEYCYTNGASIIGNNAPGGTSGIVESTQGNIENTGVSSALTIKNNIAFNGTNYSFIINPNGYSGIGQYTHNNTLTIDGGSVQFAGAFNVGTASYGNNTINVQNGAVFNASGRLGVGNRSNNRVNVSGAGSTISGIIRTNNGGSGAGGTWNITNGGTASVGTNTINLLSTFNATVSGTDTTTGQPAVWSFGSAAALNTGSASGITCNDMGFYDVNGQTPTGNANQIKLNTGGGLAYRSQTTDVFTLPAFATGALVQWQGGNRLYLKGSTDTGGSGNYDFTTTLGNNHYSGLVCAGNNTITHQVSFDNVNGGNLLFSAPVSTTVSDSFTGGMMTNTVSSGGTNQIPITVMGGTTELTVTGGIQGTGGLTLTSASNGTLKLMSDNSYSGVTTISNGKLLINGANSGTGAVNVGGSGTLGGTGSIAGAVTVSGALSPGASAGTLSFSNGLTIAAGGVFNWENTVANAVGSVGTEWDVANVTSGSTSISSTSGTGSKLNLQFTNSGTDFSNSFWDSSQTWAFITGGVSGSNKFDTSNIAVFVNAAPVGTGNTISEQGAFTTAVDGVNLQLVWTPASGGGATNGQYQLTSTANGGSSASIIVGGSVGVSTSLQNTGISPQDALNVSGVAPTASGGTVTAGTAGSASNLALSGTAASTGYSFSAGTAGAYTISASSPTVANVTASGTPIVDTPVTASVLVLGHAAGTLATNGSVTATNAFAGASVTVPLILSNAADSASLVISGATNNNLSSGTVNTGSNTTGTGTLVLTTPSSAGESQSTTFTVNYGDQQDLSGHNVAGSLSATTSAAVNVYSHGAGSVTGSLSFDPVIVGYIGTPTSTNSVSLSNSVANSAAIDIAAGSGNVAIGVNANVPYGTPVTGVTGTLANGLAAGTYNTNISLDYGDTSATSAYAGYNASLGTVAVPYSVTVYLHASGSTVGSTLDLGNIHAGYSSAVTSTPVSATNASGTRVDLAGSAAAIGNLSLNPLSGITPGGSGNITATLATGQTVGVINQGFTYTFADDSLLSGASSNVGTASLTVTGNVYSGTGVWNTDGDGNWNDFSKWTSAGGAPGLDSNFTTTDSATFASAASTNDSVVTLNAVSPSLTGVTFDNSGRSYTLAASGGGTLVLNNGGSDATLTNTAGSHTINAPITLASNVAVMVASDTLTIGGSIGGGGKTLTKNGGGILELDASNGYTGATTVHQGTLKLGASGSLASTSIVVGDAGSSGAVLDVTSAGLTVGASQTLSGIGSISGSVNVTGVLSPGGSSLESLASGNLTLGSGSFFNYQVDSSAVHSVGADLQKVTGTLDLVGTVNLTLTDFATPAAFAAGTTFSLINYTGTWNSGLFTLGTTLADDSAFTAGPNKWIINYNAADGGGNFATDYAGTTDSFVNITAAVANPGLDPDNDGVNNLGEFAFKGDANDPAKRGLFFVELKDNTVDVDAFKELTYTCAVRRSTTIAFTASGNAQTATIDGVTYTIEASLDLSNWNSAVTFIGKSDLPPAGSVGLPNLTGTGWEYCTFSAFNGLGDKGFIRAKAVQP